MQGTEPGTFAQPHRFARPQDLTPQPSRRLEQLANAREYHPHTPESAIYISC